MGGVGQVSGNEMPTKRVKTERWVADGEVEASNEAAESSQRKIKRERDLDGQTEDDQPGPSKEPKTLKFTLIQAEATAFDCYDLVRNNQRRMKAENGQKDEQGDEEEEVNGEEDEAEGSDGDQIGDNEMRAKRVKTEHWVPDGEVPTFDDRVGSSQREIKRERDLGGQTEDDENLVTASYESSSIQSAGSTITLSSDNESDRDDELVPESSTVSSVNLKLVYDVEYQPPE